MKKTLMLFSLIINKLFGMALPTALLDVAQLFATKFGAKGMMIVHAGTNELIAGFDEYEAAKQRGDTDVEVIVWDVPQSLVFGAQLLKNAKAFNYQEGAAFATAAMEYFSFKKGGAGAELRKLVDPDDKGLAEFVAQLFGTNRTTLYSWINVAANKPELLRFVDAGTVTMCAAERVVNQRSPVNISGTDASNEHQVSKPGKKNRFVKHDEITRVAQLTPTELNFITETLPNFLPGLVNSPVLPDDVLVERIYQHIAKKGIKAGAEAPTPKVDHIEIAMQVANFNVLITIHEIDNLATGAAVAVKLPVQPTDIGSVHGDLAIAA